MTDDEFDRYVLHLRAGGTPFDPAFNASIREACDGYHQVIADLKRELRAADAGG